MQVVWYVLEDGTVADPNHVASDERGVLRHACGAAVAYGPHGPRSRGVDPAEVAAAQVKAAASPAAPKKAARPAADRKMEPKPSAGYETR